jgi:hypothetical protein
MFKDMKETRDTGGDKKSVSDFYSSLLPCIVGIDALTKGIDCIGRFRSSGMIKYKELTKLLA